MTTETTEPGSNEENLKVLRQKAEQADALQGQLEQLQRELALRDSKVDTDSKVFDLFRKAYDGEWTPEALNQAAEQYGLLKQDQPQGQQPQDQQPQGMQTAADLLAAQAMQAQQQMAAAQAGGQTQSPGQLANQDWMQATSAEDFLAKYTAAGGQVVSDQ